MRNICVTQDRLNFFTKRLNAEQKAEVMSVLTPGAGGFFIEWVAESIRKRREYSESRRENRKGKKKSKPKKTSKTYVPHMENENAIVNEEGNASGKGKVITPFDSEKFKTAWGSWKKYRGEIKKPYRSEMSEQAALKNLSKYDEQTAIQMIENSIANGWQGIFELKENGKSNSKEQLKRGFAESIARTLNGENGPK